LLVGVDHEGNVVTEAFAYRLYPGEVDGGRGVPDLDLDAADAGRACRVGVVEDPFDGLV
jgi:hypothetical protein